MTTFESEVLRFEQRGPVTILTIDRAEKGNAVDTRLIQDINRFFQAVPEEARAVVLCGAGRHFCAGLDLAEHKERDPVESFEASRYWHRTLDMVEFGGVPVVAAMQGAVMGGGLEIAAATHVRVAEPSAIYQLPEGQRGIFVGGGATVRVTRIIGAGRTTEMMLTGRRVSAEEGQALGLSHYLVSEGEALDKAIALAGTIAGNAPMVNTMAIGAIGRIADMSRQEGLFTESVATALTQTSTDARAGIEAFLERRKARFDGD